MDCSSKRTKSGLQICLFDQPDLECQADGLDAAGDVEFGEDAAYMKLDCGTGHDQAAGDFNIVQAFDH